jgi:hypothetical protein
MSREMAVIVLGIWVIILPHLGIPGSWHTILITLTGLIIIAVGLYLRGMMLSRGIRRSSHHPFVENRHDGVTVPHSHEATEDIH